MSFCRARHDMIFRAALSIAMLSGLASSFRLGVVMTPINAFAFVGETVHLFCNITDERVQWNSSMLAFERGDDNTSIASQMLSTRAIRMTLRGIQLSDDGIYLCLLERPGKPEEVAAYKTVKVDVRPRKVQNFSCVVHNWEKMICTWDLGVTYNYEDYVKVSVYWVTANGAQQDCLNATKTSCLWDKNVYWHGSIYTIGIVVEYIVDDKDDKVLAKASEIKSVNTSAIVMPDAVTKIKAISQNSSCVILTWRVSDNLRDKIFLQQMRRAESGMVYGDIVTRPKKKTIGYNTFHESRVCGLDPYTLYQFRVAVRPSPESGYTSEWRAVSVRTGEDVPSAAPSICPGCYFDLPENEENLMPSRSIRLIWQHIPNSSVHGVLTHYRIWYNNQSIIKNVTSEDVHAISVDLTFPSKDEHYWVKIAGATAIGESPQAASIFVPALDRKLKPPQDFLVEWSKDDQRPLQFFLSWADWSGHRLDMRRSVSSDDHDALYIVWCPGSTTYMQCTGKFEWVRLPPETVTYKLDTDSRERDPYDFLIGIAAKNGDGFSSGIHWSACVYEYKLKPQTAPLNVRVSQVSTAEDSLVVTWQKPGCHEERSHITEYLIEYCLFNGYKCIGNKIALNVSNKETKKTLARLGFRTKYLVFMKAVSSAGFGPESNATSPLLLEKQKAKQDISGLISIIVGILVSLITICLCFCIARRCYTQRKKIPNIQDLLETESPKICPIQHHRGRPLPALPADARVERHIYGTSSIPSCMSNLGYDAKMNKTVSQRGTCANVPLPKHDHDSNQCPDADKEFGKSSPEREGDSGLTSPVLEGCSHERISLMTGPESQAVEFSNHNTLPVRSHWPSHGREGDVFQTILNDIMPPKLESSNSILTSLDNNTDGFEDNGIFSFDQLSGSRETINANMESNAAYISRYAVHSAQASPMPPCAPTGYVHSNAVFGQDYCTCDTEFLSCSKL